MSDTKVDDTPTRDLDEDGVLARLRTWYMADFSHFKEWRDEAKKAYDYVAGRQWDDKVLEKLEAEGRPASVYNIIAPMIDSVCGFEVSNRQEVRFIPVQVGDSGVNEMLTSVAMWFRDQTDGEDEDSDAFRDAAICGWGWTETRIDYEKSPDGDPDMSRIDPLTIFANAGVVKPNAVDAKRIWRINSMSRDEAAGLFPDEDPNDLDCSFGESGNGDVERFQPRDDYRNDDLTEEIPQVTIIECQWWEREPFVRFVDGATNEVKTMPEADFNKLADRLLAMTPEQMLLVGIMPPQSVVRQQKKVYRRAFIGRKILGGVTNTPVDGHFTYKAITGKRDRNKGHFFGLVRAMMHPQEWTNKLFSQIIHILNSNAKGGVLAERGAFENDRQAAIDFAKANSIVWTRPGAITQGKISPKPQAPFPAGHAQLMDFAMSSMPRVTGINLEFLGMRETEQSGVLEYQRRQAGVTILATLFDSLRRYRKDQGRLMLRLIQQYLSDDRLVRIIEKDKVKYLPLNRDLTLGEYDVIVDDAPSSPNVKERNWGILQSMLPLIQPYMTPEVVMAVAQNSPLPDSIISTLVESMQKPPPPPDPMDEQRKQIALAGMLANVDKNAASAEKSRADAMETKAKAMKEGMSIFAQLVPQDLPMAPVPSVELAGFQPGSATPMGRMPFQPPPGRMPPMEAMQPMPMADGTPRGMPVPPIAELGQ